MSEIEKSQEVLRKLQEIKDKLIQESPELKAKLEQEKELKYTTNAEDTTIPVEEENEEYKTEKAEEETSKEETKQPELKVDLLEEIAKANQKPINLKEEVEKALEPNKDNESNA